MRKRGESEDQPQKSLDITNVKFRVVTSPMGKQNNNIDLKEVLINI